jgi:hypothetical protein
MAEGCCTHVCYATAVARPREQRAHQHDTERHRPGCGAASSAPRSGRGGRRCEPCHPDHTGAWCNSSTAVSKTARCPCKSGGPCQSNLTNPPSQHIPDRPTAVVGRGQLREHQMHEAHPRRTRRRPRSCPGPSPSHDRIAQQRERRCAKPEAEVRVLVRSPYRCSSAERASSSEGEGRRCESGQRCHGSVAQQESPRLSTGR